MGRAGGVGQARYGQEDNVGSKYEVAQRPGVLESICVRRKPATQSPRRGWPGTATGSRHRRHPRTPRRAHGLPLSPRCFLHFLPEPFLARRCRCRRARAHAGRRRGNAASAVGGRAPDGPPGPGRFGTARPNRVPSRAGCRPEPGGRGDAPRHLGPSAARPEPGPRPAGPPATPALCPPSLVRRQFPWKQPGAETGTRIQKCEALSSSSPSWIPAPRDPSWVLAPTLLPLCVGGQSCPAWAPLGLGCSSVPARCSTLGMVRGHGHGVPAGIWGCCGTLQAGTLLVGDIAGWGHCWLGTLLVGDIAGWGHCWLGTLQAGTLLVGDIAGWGHCWLGTLLVGDIAVWGHCWLRTLLAGDTAGWGHCWQPHRQTAAVHTCVPRWCTGLGGCTCPCALAGTCAV
ncbi:uncharacterized protein GJ701_014753 [Geothlypis trichas]